MTIMPAISESIKSVRPEKKKIIKEPQIVIATYKIDALPIDDIKQCLTDLLSILKKRSLINKLATINLKVIKNTKTELTTIVAAKEADESNNTKIVDIQNKNTFLFFFKS